MKPDNRTEDEVESDLDEQAREAFRSVGSISDPEMHPPTMGAGPELLRMNFEDQFRPAPPSTSNPETPLPKITPGQAFGMYRPW